MKLSQDPSHDLGSSAEDMEFTSAVYDQAIAAYIRTAPEIPRRMPNAIKSLFLSNSKFNGPANTIEEQQWGGGSDTDQSKSKTLKNWFNAEGFTLGGEPAAGDAFKSWNMF